MWAVVTCFPFVCSCPQKMVASPGKFAPLDLHCHISLQQRDNDDLTEKLGSLNDKLLDLTWILWCFAKVSHVLHMNILIAPLIT